MDVMSWFLLPFVTALVVAGPFVPAIPAWLWFRYWDRQDKVRTIRENFVLVVGFTIGAVPYLALAIVGVLVWDPTLFGCPPYAC